MSVIVSTVNIARSVTKAIEDYRNLPEDFVADYVAPVVPVTTKSGQMPRFGRKNQKRINFKVSPGSPSPRVDYDLATTDFACAVHRGSTHLPLELETFDGTGLLNAGNLGIQVDEALRIEREFEVATFMGTTGNFTHTNTSTPGTLWDASGGNPAESVNEVAKGRIKTNIRKVAQYGLATFDVMLFLQQFVAELRVGGGNASLASYDEVAKYLGLKEVRVAGAGYDSTEPGDASVSADIWGTKDFWVFHKPVNMTQFTPSFLTTARFKKLSTSRIWTTDDPEGIMVESRDCYDFVDVDDSAGYYFVNVIG